MGLKGCAGAQAILADPVEGPRKVHRLAKTEALFRIARSVDVIELELHIREGRQAGQRVLDHLVHADQVVAALSVDHHAVIIKVVNAAHLLIFPDQVGICLHQFRDLLRGFKFAVVNDRL